MYKRQVFTTGDGPEILTLTGGATGLFCGYVDFIAWDIQTALQMAKKFFEDSDIPLASFHTFRREAGTVNLFEDSDIPWASFHTFCLLYTSRCV